MFRGCNFQAISLFNQNQTARNMISEDTNAITLIVDNTFYPCNNGAYQSEVYILRLR